MDRSQICQFIDHTLLKNDATESEIKRLCQEAIKFRFKTVCVERRWLKVVSSELKGTSVLPISVVGFPSGEEATVEKIKQAEEAMEWGAQELDMVLNRTLLFHRDYYGVLHDIESVVKSSRGRVVKVILETSELETAQKVIACALVKAARAHFVKTSTGFSKMGATESDVQLMRSVVGPDFGVKASGGIRSLESFLKMVEAGANRIGTSNAVGMIQGSAIEGTY